MKTEVAPNPLIQPPIGRMDKLVRRERTYSIVIMIFKFTTVTLNDGVDRITFSREEILAMRNSINEDDPKMAFVLIFLDKMEEELLNH